MIGTLEELLDRSEHRSMGHAYQNAHATPTAHTNTNEEEATPSPYQWSPQHMSQCVVPPPDLQIYSIIRPTMVCTITCND